MSRRIWKRFRSAATGRFLTAEQARQSPATSVAETVTVEDAAESPPEAAGAPLERQRL